MSDIIQMIAWIVLIGLFIFSRPNVDAPKPEEDKWWIEWQQNETTTAEETTTEEETEAETMPPTNSSYVMQFTDAEKDLMARVAYWECGNHGWEGMALVVNVIINRANLYNASVTDIIYSPNQFQVLDYIYTREPSPEAYTAVEAVMQGWDASQGALYFCSPAHNGWHSSHLTYLFTYGGTEFYR